MSSTSHEADLQLSPVHRSAAQMETVRKAFSVRLEAKVDPVTC